MPGIVGLITRMPRKDAESQLLRMLGTMRHEAFYEMGTWVDESLGAYVGWSVRKNSFSDGMPLRTERKDVTLVFSGEEYPDPGIVRCLENRGHTVHAPGPEYLVHQYEEAPAVFLAGLNGRFHGVLADHRQGTATLFNDRYGLQRVYYHEARDAFYFAAEAKAILAVRPELRRADPRGLAEFVACGCVLENRTLFDGICVLPCASAWIFRHGSLESKKEYFQPREWEEQSELDPESYYRAVEEIFSRNLPRYFEGTEPIAVSLTGGLDTRMVMAWQRRKPGSLPCYTFGGMMCDSQDVVVAREVAEACGQPHQVIPVGHEFLSRFQHYAERTVYLTDGCADVSRSADLFVNQKARAIGAVRMTGNYGGEVLRHVRAFKTVKPSEGLFDSELLSYVHKADETYANLLSEHPLSFAVFRAAPWWHYGLLALEQTQVCTRSPFLDNELVRMVFRAPQSSLVGDDFCLRLITEGWPALRAIWTDRGPTASGVRADAIRSAAVFMRKAEYAYDYGMPQWVARIDHVLSPLRLERLFLGRQKFAYFRLWYRDPLAGYVRDVLLDPRTLSRPYLVRKTVEGIVEGHLAGNRNYTTEIHKILTLELVHRLLLEAAPPPTEDVSLLATAGDASVQM
jgi:asparagine synthase (glutamine-hydrolysing)